jgi:Tfp pilus assembly protein PilF
LLAAWVLGCLPGCSHQVATVPAGTPNPATAQALPMKPAAVALGPNATVKKESDLPPRQPSAAVCVAGGDLCACEAASPRRSRSEQQHFQEEGRKAYQQALSIDGKYLPAYYGLARLYEAMGDHAHAVATYKNGLKVAPQTAGLWFELGMCYGRQKDWQAALEGLTKAAELEPENRHYANTLGYALAWVGRYQDSLQCFSRVMSEAQAHCNLARMLAHQKQTDLAKQHLQVALQQDPQNAEAQELLAQVEGRGADPVQPVVHTEMKPEAPQAVPPAPESAALPVILPPPPKLEIQKQAASPAGAPQQPDGAVQ